MPYGLGCVRPRGIGNAIPPQHPLQVEVRDNIRQLVVPKGHALRVERAEAGGNDDRLGLTSEGMRLSC